MNEYYILRKESLKSLLKALLEDFCVVSPQKAYSTDFLFQETEELKNIALDYDITSNTLKEFFFPRQETIFRYQRHSDGSAKIMTVQHTDARQTIFFGLRSCDTRAVYFHDRFFDQEPKDMLYWQKRSKGILISFVCNKPPRSSCFCAYTNSGPFLEQKEGFDLQYIDINNEYLVEIGTEKGAALIKRYRKFFTIANDTQICKKTHLREDCLRFFSPKYDIMALHTKLKTKDLSRIWLDLGRRCTNCGGCEFICPTCFCFYTQDIEYSPSRGERLRCWDSCTFKGYSRMAGDTNPHERNSDRISRRFFCKLYNCYRWFGVFACTGCGRCSYVCPVNLDMESFIASLMQDNIYKPLLKEL